MAIGIEGIDHPVIAVRSMDAGRAAYERLGFTIPPRGSHLEWGTGNWCIMFPDDYLELRGIVDPDRYTHGLDRLLAEREGLMGVAFSVPDAAGSYAMAQGRGVAAHEPRELTRRFELPEGDAFPKFRLVFLQPDHAPGLMGALMIEHLTPGLIRRPDWLEHENGALAVAAMTAVVEDPAAAREAHARLFGTEAVAAANGHVVSQVGRGARVEAVTPGEAERRGVGLAGIAPPYLSAVAVRVADPERTAAVLTRRGVLFQRRADALRVGPDHTCGVVLDFVP